MADITKEKLMQALQAADAAGNAEDVAKIKQIWDAKFSGAGESQAPKEEGLLGKIDQVLLGVGQGLVADTLVGAGQLASHLADVVLPGQIASESFNKYVANPQEEAYQKLRTKLGGKGIDPSRLVGNLLPAFFAPGIGGGAAAVSQASKLGKLAKPLEKTGEALFTPVTAAGKGLEKLGVKGASKLTGGTLEPGSLGRGISFGVQAPLLAREKEERKQGEDYFKTKLIQSTIGGIAGGALSPLAKLAPSTTPNTELGKILKNAGLGTTGQRTGNLGTENLFARVTPFGGGSIHAKQDKALEYLNNTYFKNAYGKLWKDAAVTKSRPFEFLDNVLGKKIDDLAANKLSVNVPSLNVLKDVRTILKNNFIDDIRPLTQSEKAAKATVGALERIGKMKVTGPLKEAEATGRLPRTLQNRSVDQAIKKLRELKEKLYKGDTADHTTGEWVKKFIKVLEKQVANQQSNKSFLNQLTALRRQAKQKFDLEEGIKRRGTPIGSGYGVQSLIGSGALGAFNPAFFAGIPALAAATVPGLAFLSPKIGRTLGTAANLTPQAALSVKEAKK